VNPGKNDSVQLEISGAQVNPGNRVFTMLSNLYDGCLAECDIDIVFRPTGGRQENPCRDVFVAYVGRPNVENGRAAADRLQRVTTHRSGLGLFFLVVGSENAKLLMVSRFPADQGVVAQERDRHRLEVEFIERIFMKNARAYKSAVYAGPAAAGGFWRGQAVDKQMNDVRELSNYWIGEFLDSELATTGALGTRRLATAFREAIKKTENPEVRNDLIAASRGARGHQNRFVTPHRLAEQLGLNPEATDALKEEMPRPELFEERFRFEREEFDRHVMYRSIELSNGAVLTAENARFDEVFRTDPITETEAVYSTTGSIVTEKLKKTL
jgi:hypothetical protein